MEKYIYYFEGQSAFNNAYNGEDYSEPWVSYTDETRLVHYNKVIDYKNQYLTFEFKSNGTFKCGASGIEYKVNNGAWSAAGAPVEVASGDKVQLRADGVQFGYGGYPFRETTGQFIAYGNVMSLMAKEGFEDMTELPDETYDFGGMFGSCTGLTDARNLIIPLTTIPSVCCKYMFLGCTNLVNVPKLPATSVEREGCYAMFSGCTSLVNAPALPATTLGIRCYALMFAGCTSLVNAPSILPATTLGNYSYQEMFMGCTSLETAPVLVDANLTESSLGAYNGMFYNCSSLNYIKCLGTSISVNFTGNWVSGVAATGTFVKHPDETWTTGTSGIPSGWTVETATR